VIDGQHNLVYDNHKATRLRRRLPITTETAEIITTWQRRREQMPTALATRQWLFPSPLLRSRQAHGHLIASSNLGNGTYITSTPPPPDVESTSGTVTDTLVPLFGNVNLDSLLGGINAANPAAAGRRLHRSR
jgi:hypothetical protein